MTPNEIIDQQIEKLENEIQSLDCQISHCEDILNENASQTGWEDAKKALILLKTEKINSIEILRHIKQKSNQ